MGSQLGWWEDAQPEHPILGVQARCAPTLTPRGIPPELPVSILRPLRDKIAMEKHRGVLECQMSRASAQVRWFKGSVELHPGAKYEMVSDGLYRKLVINAVQPEDEDTYTCDAGDVKTSAQFFVEGLGRAGWKLFLFSLGEGLWPVALGGLGFPGGASGKEPVCQCSRCKRPGFGPWVGKIPWRRAGQPTPVFLPGESHRRRSLAGYSP